MSSPEQVAVCAIAVSKVVSTIEGDLSILDAVSLEINAGESVAIVGESGSGKTTLLGILAGLDIPSSGQVWFEGNDITAMNEEQRAQVRAASVGFVFQSFQLLDSLNALENVMLPGELRGDGAVRKEATAILKRVGLGNRITHYPRQLSGGEQQRVALARAFASKPSVLFADEPTGNLDTRTGEDIIDLLFEMNREFNTTLILVTHDKKLADRCDRSLVLSAGSLVFESRDVEPGSGGSINSVEQTGL
ncbi:MAG: ABC transporter ATP-binding protein [Pseudomonadales bacterium]|nr:ABC transporter ATP-binding protein [Pseudomonadales bacterium]